MHATTKFTFLAAGSIVAIACSGWNNPASAPSGASNQGQEQGAGGYGRMGVTQYYTVTCGKCHGDRAQGGGGGTPSLLTLEKYDQKYDKPFFDAIKNGVPDAGMEGYGSTLSDAEIWAQVVHIRELQSRGLREQSGSPRAVGGVYKSQRANFRVETVLDKSAGLRLPWAIDWLPDGTMLVTNRSGYIVTAKGGKVGARVEGIPESKEQGQGGLMDVAVHPDYAKNGWVYLAYSEAGRQKGAMTKIVRGKLGMSGGSARWTAQQTIWEADQKFYTGAGIHFGSRIVFDRKGQIFFSVGERGGNMLAQKLDTPFGKVYRLNEDGSEPADNPYIGKTGGIKGVWSFGHRNQQGLTIDAEGNLWDTEHGPRGGDEVNLIKRGANYGWPVVAFSINYNDTPFMTPWPTADQKIEMPIFRWLPSIGACGMDTMRGPAFPAWKGDLLAGGLSGQNLDRIRVKGGKLIEREELLQGMGRVREVAVGPDGFIYVALNDPDIIIRLVPAK